jgi:hypothetical protein
LVVVHCSQFAGYLWEHYKVHLCLCLLQPQQLAAEEDDFELRRCSHHYPLSQLELTHLQVELPHHFRGVGFRGF